MLSTLGHPFRAPARHRQPRPLVFRRAPAIIFCLAFIATNAALAFQTVPASGAIAQGAFTSSGAPANSSGPQGAAYAQGGAANTGRSQPGSPAAGNVAAEDRDARLARIESASRSGESEAVLSYLRDTDAVVQTAAFEALAALDQKAAVRELLSVIHDSSAVTRYQALQLLDGSPIFDEQTVRATLRRLASDPDGLLRQYAFSALAIRDADRASSGGQGAAGGRTQGPFAAAGGVANTGAIQGEGIASGGRANTAAVQSALPAAAVRDPVADPQDTKLVAIAGATDATAVRRYLSDTDPIVQGAAFERMSQMDSDVAVQALVEVLRDPQSLARANALRLLVSSAAAGNLSAVTAVRAVSRDGDPGLRQDATEALAVLESNP